MPSIHRYASSINGLTNAHEDERFMKNIMNDAKEMERHPKHIQATMNTNEKTEVIRDEIQSHNDEFSTNLRSEASAYASVSQLPHQVQQLTSIHRNIDNNKNDTQELSTNDTMTQLVIDNASTARVPASANESPSDVVPRLTGSSVLEPNTTSSHPTKVKKRKRRLNDSVTAMDIMNESTSTLPTNNVLSTPARSSTGSSTTGRWTSQEHQAFVRGLALYGREWKRVALDIPTRTSAQVRSHAQKYLSKMEKQMSLAHQEHVDHQNHHHIQPSAVRSNDIVTPEALRQSKDRNHNNFIVSTDPSLATSRWGTNLPDNAFGTVTVNDGSPTSNDDTTESEYQSMTDSVRQQAARILANPTTVEQEVRETISQLRDRYQQLQERIQKQQQCQYSQGRQQTGTTTSVSNNGNGDQNRNLIWREPIHDGQGRRNKNMSNNDGTKTCRGTRGTDQMNRNEGGKIDPGKSSYTTSSLSTTASHDALQPVLYSQHDDDELIALHVLQGLQKQQLRI